MVPPQDGLDVYLRNSPVIKAVAPPDLMMMHDIKLTPRPTEQELEEDDGHWALAAIWRALPRWLRGTSPVLSMGSGGRGVAFHKHAAAWLLLLQGRKLWFLYPPDRAVYSSNPACVARARARGVSPRPVARSAPAGIVSSTTTWRAYPTTSASRWSAFRRRATSCLSRISGDI